MEKISSLTNPLIKSAVQLLHKKHQQRAKRFLVPHERIIKCLNGRYAIIHIFCLAPSYPKASQYGLSIVVPENIIKKLVPFRENCDMVAVCSFTTTSFDFTKNALLLDNIQDPGNLGALIRTAVGTNFSNIILMNNTVSYYNMRTIIASQGAVFQCNIVENPDQKIITDCVAHRYKLIATAQHEQAPFNWQHAAKANTKIVLMMGNEGHGLSPNIIAQADMSWWLPMHNNLESLNVGVAGSIMMYLYYSHTVVDIN